MSLLSGITIDEDSFWTKFKDNSRLLWNKATTWVASLWATVEVLWNVIGDDVKNQIVQGVVPTKYVGVGIAAVGITAYLAAHGWPQPKLQAKAAALKEADTITRGGPPTVPSAHSA